MASERISWLEEVTDESLCIGVDTAVYSLEALFRVCYGFTDKCYLFLQPEEASSVVRVKFSRKTPDCDLPSLAGEFSNELINQKVRQQIASETRAIRELIVAQAFAEADLLDRSLSESSYINDPKGIAG
ncbi:MAG TPA: His-Xaa-Ser system protein HxsD [Pyrinomonadaceae bacterium]|jgi:His-Xaa-Ser system protein HxsD